MAKRYKNRCFLSLDDKYLHILISSEQQGEAVYQKVIIDDLKQSNHQLIQMLARCERYLILTSDSYRMLTMPRPDVPDRFLDDAVKWQLVEKLNFNISTAQVNYCFTDELKSHLLAIASPAEKFNQAIDRFKNLGLTLQGVFPMDVIFSRLSNLFQESRSVVLHFEENKLALIVIKDHRIQEIVYFPNINDPDLLSKVSLIIKSLLEKHEMVLNGMPIFYCALDNDDNKRNDFENLFSNWNAVLYDVNDYVSKETKQANVDDHYAALFIAMRYSEKNKLGKADLNFYSSSTSKRFRLGNMGNYLNYLFIISAFIIVAFMLIKFVNYIRYSHRLTKLETEQTREGESGSTKSEKEQVVLRIDQQTLDNNISLYDWLLPLAENVQKGMWINNITIDQQKGTFILTGQALSSQGVLRFADQLQKSSQYRDVQLKVGKEEEKEDEFFAPPVEDDRQKFTPPPVEDWTISHPDAKTGKAAAKKGVLSGLGL